MPPAPQLSQPPRWTPDELERDRQRAIEIFRKQRLEEPLEVYLEALLQRELTKVDPQAVRTLAEGPGPRQFCRESMLGTRKADFIIGLPDRRVMPLECKVSNSYTNSIKRLNNDAAAKAEVWRRDFGDMNVIPAAVLSGVYKLHHLEDAQRRGLTLFWSHSLDLQLLDWIMKTW